ncbi:MAG: hypothetical protein KUG81_09925 [Gammaproteobacteria bacterium]|nr:hypothetical protein [Gammaproteobacteria bacterium]
MKTFTVTQLKEAIITLYSKNDDASFAAYGIAFDLLQKKIGDDKMDQFLDAYGL